MPLDLLPRVIAPKHSCQNAAAGHGDAFGAVPRGKTVVLPAGYGKGLLPPAVQAFASIGADGQHAVPRSAAGFCTFKLRANLLAHRACRPLVSGKSVTLAI